MFGSALDCGAVRIRLSDQGLYVAKDRVMRCRASTRDAKLEWGQWGLQSDACQAEG